MKNAKPHDTSAVTLTVTQEEGQWLRVWPGESDSLGSNPASVTYWLCILVQVTYPLWASVSSSVREDNTSTYITGIFGGPNRFM